MPEQPDDCSRQWSEAERRLSLRIDYLERAIAEAKLAKDIRWQELRAFEEGTERRHRGIEIALKVVEVELSSLNGKLWAFGVSITMFATLISMLMRWVIK